MGQRTTPRGHGITAGSLAMAGAWCAFARGLGVIDTHRNGMPQSTTVAPPFASGRLRRQPPRMIVAHHPVPIEEVSTAIAAASCLRLDPWFADPPLRQPFHWTSQGLASCGVSLPASTDISLVDRIVSRLMDLAKSLNVGVESCWHGLQTKICSLLQSCR